MDVGGDQYCQAIHLILCEYQDFKAHIFAHLFDKAYPWNPGAYL